MKKVILLVLITVMTVSVLNGCGTGVASPKYRVQDVCPNLLSVGDTNTSGGYSYLVDKNTGVVYLRYDGHNQKAITVMLNVDGTPIIAEQLGIEY